MNKDSAETNANFLAKDFEYQLKEFLAKNLVEKLETIQKRIFFSNPELSPIVNELIKKAKDSENDAEFTFSPEQADDRLWTEISFYFQMHFEDLFCFITLQSLLAASFSGLPADYRSELIESNNLTPGQLRDSIFETLKKTYLGKIKQGGDRLEFWNTATRLYFLSIYNRFQIVIKNARNDLIIQQKSGKRESVAKREIIEKYLIPNDYSKFAFSNDSPANLAMDWAKDVMSVRQETSSIRRDVLREARTEARKYNSSRKLISVYKFDLNRAVTSMTVTAESVSNLRFRDLVLNNSTMLYFI